MQTSPYEIKDKLLRAIDKEYNVVDMATVFEVISMLEKTIITRETLEKTRIGKYINELRKRTSNEQLARRAKDLVKSWRKLLPQSDNSVNGERVISSNSSIGTSVYPPGKFPKPCGSVPGSPCLKNTSPSVSCEHSTSPFYSSASNSPQLTKLQGANKPLTPSNYAPTKYSQAGIRSDKSESQNKSNPFCSQIFKPVSPALAAAKHANSNNGAGGSADHIPQPKPRCISPAHLNSSRSCSPRVEASAMQTSKDVSVIQQKFEKVISPVLSVRPPASLGSAHSSLDIAKTNVANKRLRKDACDVSKTKKSKSVLYDNSSCESSLQNGIDCVPELTERLLPSESSAFKSLSSLKLENERNSFKDEKLERQKPDISCDSLREKFSSLGSGAKLPKVKTTQQLIEELQARKDPSTQFLKLSDFKAETDNFSLKTTNNSLPSAELLRSKSELMKKFLSCTPESPSNSGPESPSVERVSSPLSDNVPSKSSVITPDKDFSVPFTDPVSAEIEQILSTLPPINPEDINLDDDYELLPERVSVTDEDVDKYLEQWEYVNGNHSADGSWRPWQECTESKILPDETIRILPYVNID